jgi:hypothetical protein
VRAPQLMTLAALVALGVAAPPVLAHEGNPNFLSQIERVTPPA